jgi:hypothetical protein
MMAAMTCFIHVQLQMTKRLLKTLENTRFAGSPVIPVAAKPGGPEVCLSILLFILLLI